MEKNASWGRHVGRPLGAVLLLLAAWTAVGAQLPAG